MAGRERLRIDEVARELAPHGGKLLGWRRASGSPQYQERHPDLPVLVGRIHLEIDGGECAIVAARTSDRLVGEAANVVDMEKAPLAASAINRPANIKAQ
jgi:hypothetical protein